LSDETARWPTLGHPNPLEIGRPAAAKISSTAGGESNWVFGYTPQRLVTVWLGYPEEKIPSPAGSSKTMRLATAGLWHALMQYSNAIYPFKPSRLPPV